jgi:hypothetical protein
VNSYEGVVKAIMPESQFVGFSFMLDLGSQVIWVAPDQQAPNRPNVGDKINIVGEWYHPQNTAAARNPLFRAYKIVSI